MRYKVSGFRLEILEYCASAEECIAREQYYLDLLQPEYNILKTAGSSLGYIHTEEARAKMRICGLSKERLEHLKELNTDLEMIAKRLEHLEKLNSSEAQKERLKKLNSDPELIAKRLAKIMKPVEILDLQTGQTTIFCSLKEAAKQLGLHYGSLKNVCLKASKNPSEKPKPFKRRYIILYIPK